MAAVDDVDELIERYHLALGEFMKGNPEPAKRLWSRREDASLTNPQGSVACGGPRSPRPWITPPPPVGMAGS